MKQIFLSLWLALLTFPLLCQQTEGMASYYADRFQGEPTSTGEHYDKNALTAASKDYPYGTILQVTDIVSKKKVKVRINDCGPHHPDRIIDLSRAAAKKIGLLRKGSAMVEISVVELGDLGPTCERSSVIANTKVAQPKPAADEMLFGVQVGSFGKEENAKKMVARLTDLGFEGVYTVKKARIYRVYAGKFYFQQQATDLRDRIRKAGIKDATVRRVQ